MAVIAAILILTGMVEAVWGLLQLSGVVDSRHALFPITGSFFNPGPYGCFLAMILPLGVAFASRREILMRRLGMVYIMLSVAPLSASMSRTGWLAALAGCGVTILLLNLNWLTATWRRLCVFHSRHHVIAYLSVVSVLVALSIASYGLISFKSQSAGGRVLIWKIGIEAMYEAPLSGVGWDNVAGAYGEAQEAYFSSHSDEDEIAVAGSPEYLFNEYLQIGVAYGIFAMILFVFILAGGILCGLKGRAYGFTGALLAFMVVSFASYPLQFSIFVVCASVITLCCYWSMICRGFSMGLVMNSLLSLVVGFVCVSVLLGRHERESVKEEWESGARQLYLTRIYSTAVKEYATYYDRMDWNAGFLFEYGHSLHKTGRYEDSNGVLKKAMEVSSDPMILNIVGKNYQAMGKYSSAERYYRRSINRQPALLYPRYLLMRLFEKTGDTVAMKGEAEYLVSHRAKVPSPAEEEMRDYARRILCRQ